MSAALDQGSAVIAGLDPAIHRARARAAWMDARVKPGHDGDGAAGQTFPTSPGAIR